MCVILFYFWRGGRDDCVCLFRLFLFICFSLFYFCSFLRVPFVCLLCFSVLYDLLFSSTYASWPKFRIIPPFNFTYFPFKSFILLYDFTDTKRSRSLPSSHSIVSYITTPSRKIMGQHQRMTGWSKKKINMYSVIEKKLLEQKKYKSR